jgi:hypothetical protein
MELNITKAFERYWNICNDDDGDVSLHKTIYYFRKYKGDLNAYLLESPTILDMHRRQTLTDLWYTLIDIPADQLNYLSVECVLES